MPQQIDVPGMGIVEFPDGMNDDAISAAIKQNMPSKRIGISDVASMAWNDIKRTAANVAGAVHSGVTLPRDVITGAAQLPSSGAVPGSVEFGDPRSAGGRVADMAMLATPLSPAARAGEAAIPGAMKATVTEASPKPTIAAVDATAGQQFGQAKNMGVAIDPNVRPALGTMLEQHLQNKGILEEHAPITYKTIERLKKLPEEGDVATTTISDLHNLRQAFGNAGGNINFPKDTLGGKAGIELLDKFLSSIPEKTVLAGDAPAASALLKDAIGNTAAVKRAEEFDTRLTKAERATDRSIAGSIDSQTRAKAGQVLDSAKASRGLSAAELAQLENINSGGKTFSARNILRQFGRGGAGVVPMGAHAITAYMTGGASVPLSLAVGTPLYAARKIAEQLTKREAGKLQDMLLSRSPYAASLPETITRGMTGGEQGMRAARMRSIAELLNAQGQR